MRNLKKLIAVFCALCLLVTALSGLNFTAFAATDANELAQFQQTMAAKDTLAPGKTSFQDPDDNYVYRMFVSRGGPSSLNLSNMSVDDADPATAYYHLSQTFTNWGRTANCGDIFEIPNKYILHYTSNSCAWHAMSVVYKVQGNTWVGTGLTNTTNRLSSLTTKEEKLNAFRNDGIVYQVSRTGEVWEDISSSVTYDAPEAYLDGRHTMANCWAIAYIPTGYNYYRIVLSNNNDSLATNPDLRVQSTYVSGNKYWSQGSLGGGLSCAAGLGSEYIGIGIGASICSAFDLTEIEYEAGNYTKYLEIPDYPAFTTDREKAWDAAMQSKKVLTPGTLDDMSTTEYMHAAFLSGDTDKEGGQKADQRFKNGLAYNGYQVGGGTIDGFATSPYGNFWGLQNKNIKGIDNVNGIGRGYGISYNVVGGTSVAVALTANTANMDMDNDGLVGSKSQDVAMDEDEAEIFFTQMTHYQYSYNGVKWFDITPTIDIQSYGWESGVSQTAVAVASVKLPENAKYYRVVPHVHTDSWTALNNGTTLYGGSSGYANGSWHGGILENINGKDGLNGFYFGIAGAMASTTDLTTYEGTFGDLPEGTKYTIALTDGLTANKTSAKAGETIEITVDADKFMVAGSLRLNGTRLLHKSDATTPDAGAGNKFYFTMPAQNSEVTAEFKETDEVTLQDNIASIGASVHSGSDVRALRFLTRVNVNKDGQVEIGGKAYDVAAVGMVLLPETMLGANELTMETENALNVEAKYLNDRTGKYMDYYCGVKNLSVALQQKEIVGRAYITYVVDGQLVTEYAAPQSATFATINGGTVNPPAAQ